MKASDPPSATVLTPERSHANNFDILRFILALCVIFTHAFDLMGQSERNPLVGLFPFLSLGGQAVSGFFLLSGYLITASWMRSRSTRDYFTRRALRIYPGFVVVSLLCGLIVGPLCADSAKEYWHFFSPAAFVSHILMLRLIAAPTFGHFTSLNGSLWTIHEEFICYAFVALIGAMGAFRRRNIVCALLLVTFGVSGVITGYPSLLHLRGSQELLRLSWLIPVFLFGSCFYLYQDKITYSARGAVLSLIGFLALERWGGLGAFLSLPLFAYLLFTFAFSSRIRLYNFARYGDFSYGLYLYAFPIQLLLIHRFAPVLNPWALFLLATPLTFCCAVLSWNLVEKPFLRRKAKPLPTAARPDLAVSEEASMATAGAAG